MIGDLKQNQRLVWADYCKFLAIGCVVLGHAGVNDSCRTFIYMFHMPIFFFLSGYFEKGRSVLLTLKHVLRTLFIPYLFFSFLSFLWCWTSPVMHPELYPDMHSMQQIFFGAFIGIFLMDDTVKSFAFLPNGPLWFLAALIVIKIIFSLLFFFVQFVNRRYKMEFWILIMGCSVVSFMGLRQVDYFSIDSAMMGLPFYILGFLLKQTSVMHSYVKYSLLGGVISFIYLVVWGVKNNYVDMDGGVYGNSILLFYLNAVVGICFLISLSILCSKYRMRMIQFLGENTLVILAFHLFIIQVLKCVERFVLHTDIPALIVALIVLLSCIPIAVVLNKHLPWAIGHRKCMGNKAV